MTRRTLLCHSDVPLQRQIHPAVMREFEVAPSKPLSLAHGNIQRVRSDSARAQPNRRKLDELVGSASSSPRGRAFLIA